MVPAELERIKKYILNVPLEIFDMNNPNFKFSGSIINVSQSTITIQINPENIDSDIYLNRIYGVKIFRESSLFTFQGLISSIQNKVAIIKILSPIEKIQNRKYCRLKLLGKTKLYIPDLNMTNEAIFYNISEGGLAIVTSQILLKGDTVLLDIPFISLKELKGIVLNEMHTPFFEVIPMSSVVQFIASMEDSKPKNLETFIRTYNKAYAIEFEHENQKTPDKIRKFIFNTQLKRNEENKYIITYEV